jgi:hypothetical protein
MPKLVSAEELAKMLADAAEGLTPREYTLVLEEVLGDLRRATWRRLRATCRPLCANRVSTGAMEKRKHHAIC